MCCQASQSGINDQIHDKYPTNPGFVPKKNQPKPQKNDVRAHLGHLGKKKC